MLNSLHSSRKRIEIDTATDNGVGFVTNDETTTYTRLLPLEDNHAMNYTG